jgi:CP family cyanate transporter-like MFS transporter
MSIQSTRSAEARIRSKADALSPALVLAGLLMVAGNLRAGITTVGPVLDDIRGDLGLSAVTASVLVSLPLVAFALVSPVAPALGRRLGFERCLALALVVLIIGLVVRSLPGLPLLWVGTGLLGVAIAVLNVVLPALVKRDFPTRIGQITGTYSAVQSIFAAAAAGVAVPLSRVGSLGWRLPLGAWAGLGLLALGVMAPQLSRRTAVPAVADDVTVRGTLHPESAGRAPWRHALAWQVTAFMGLQSVAFYVLITWLPSIEQDAGVSAAAAGAHQFMLNAFAIVGSLLCSRLLPRLADQRLLATSCPAALVVTVVGIVTVPQFDAVWACLAGLAGGGTIVLALSFFGLRTRHHSQAASLSGMAQSVGYLLAAGGPIVLGAIHDAAHSWTPALLLLLALQIALVGFGYLAGRDRVLP